MIKKSLIYSVSDLTTANLGSIIKYEIDKVSPFTEFKALSNIEGDLEIMRIEKSLNVIIKNLRLDLEWPHCLRCLKSFEYSLEIDETERQFYYSDPEGVFDPAEIHLVDQKHQRIDITDMLRQEIILHFQTFPVCSNSCQGICDQCGIDRNTEKCECKEVEAPKNNPFSALKDLIK